MPPRVTMARADSGRCHPHLMRLDGTAAGLWLVGLGALLSALPRLVRAPRPELGLRWESLADRLERVRYAVETVGLLLVAIGSVVLAAVELGAWWFALGVVVLAILAIWLVAAAKLRQLWLMRADHAHDYGPADPPLAGEAEQRTVALAAARWSICFRRALAPTGAWPPPPSSSAPTGAYEPNRLEPRHIAELHQQDARLEAAHIPSAIAHDVALIRAQGWTIDVVGDAVIATAPDQRGNAHVSRDRVALNSAVAVAARQLWLHQLQELGLDVRPGPRGQPQVVGGIEWRLSDAPVE